MKICERYDEVLWEAAETGTTASELAGHLADCSACRERLEGLRAAVRGFSALRSVDAPVPALGLIVQRKRAWWQSWLAPATAAACAVVIGLGIYLSYPARSQRGREIPQVVKASPPPASTAPLPQVAPRKQLETVRIVEKTPTKHSITAQPISGTRRHHRRARIRQPEFVNVPKQRPRPPVIARSVNHADHLIHIMGHGTSSPIDVAALPAPLPANISVVSDLPITTTITPVDTAAEVSSPADGYERLHIFSIEPSEG